MIIGTTNLVINEIGAVFNVRIEGDTDANLFYTDATNSRVGVGTVGPTAKLDVVGGDIRIDNGNLILGTSGKGVDFSAVVHSGSTSKILNDYEIGEWTPTDGSGASLSFATAVGKYTKIGRAVFVEFRVTYPSTASASNAVIANLPFTINNNDRDNVPVTILSDGSAVSGMFNQGGTDFNLYTIGTLTTVTNVTLTAKTIRGSGWYVVA